MKEVENSIRKMNNLGAGNIPFLFIVDFEMMKPVLMTLEEALTKNILYDVNGLTNYDKKRNIDKKVVLKKYPAAFDDYFKSFNIVADNLKAGNTYLLNLTFQTKIEINFSLV